MGDRINHAEAVARRKLEPLPENFEFCGWEIIGPDTVVFRGGPVRLLKKGPNKGKRRWDKVTHKVAVTKHEEIDELLRYEKETGNCGVCGGDGQEWAGWHHINGHKYKKCTRCGGLGKIKH
jgi:hypothetical protein